MAPEMASEILVAREGSVEIITLNRPDKLNSFTDTMHAELRDALEGARDDTACRAILITGAGRAFCAGQDLGDRDPRTMEGPPDLEHTLSTFYHPLLKLIRQTPKPLICAVNGVAAGAGANVALACDIVLAGESANFIQAFSKIGLIPDAGGTWSLTQLIGPARARAIAMTAEPVSAQKAESWGMIYKACKDDLLMQEALDLAKALSSGAPQSLAGIKHAMQSAVTSSFEEQIETEAKLQGRLGRSADYAEGVSAFLEKRPAVFTGK